MFALHSQLIFRHLYSVDADGTAEDIGLVEEH